MANLIGSPVRVALDTGGEGQLDESLDVGLRQVGHPVDCLRHGQVDHFLVLDTRVTDCHGEATDLVLENVFLEERKGQNGIRTLDLRHSSAHFAPPVHFRSQSIRFLHPT